MPTTQEDRRKAAQARHTQTKEVKPLKTTTIDTAKVNAGLNEGMSLLEATKAAATTVSGDQKPVPATTSGDQKDAKPKSKKKLSPTVVEWHRITKAKEAASGKITLTDKGKADKPKRNKAMDRFKLYRDGMSVAEYIEESHKAGNSKALAQADVRWDVAKGLITVS